MPAQTSVILIGLMGAGKTSVGQELARRLDLPFSDLDAVIEQNQNRTIRDIFENEGEAYFRQLEHEALAALYAKGPLVLSTGGGVPLRDDNWVEMRKLGTVVWLDVPTDVAADRVQGADNRPLLHGVDIQHTLQRLFSERRSFYANADLHISAAASINEVCDSILSSL